MSVVPELRQTPLPIYRERTAAMDLFVPYNLVSWLSSPEGLLCHHQAKGFRCLESGCLRIIDAPCSGYPEQHPSVELQHAARVSMHHPPVQARVNLQCP